MMNRQPSGISKSSKRNKTMLPQPPSNIHYATVNLFQTNSLTFQTGNTFNHSFANTTSKNLSSQPTSQVIWKRVKSPSGGNTFKETMPKDYQKSKAITELDMIRVLHLSQTHASKVLNCSLSTLKRRFYELKKSFGLRSWPQTYNEVRKLPIFKKMYPMNLSFILNERDEEVF